VLRTSAAVSPAPPPPEELVDDELGVDDTDTVVETSPTLVAPLNEKERILAALHRCAGNQTLAARMLGISRRTLLSRLDQHGIARPRKVRPPP
jgi:transcriptional regulator of acetoin/glycerol metabolism